MKRLYGTADLEAELFEDSGVPVEEAEEQEYDLTEVTEENLAVLETLSEEDMNDFPALELSLELSDGRVLEYEVAVVFVHAEKEYIGLHPKSDTEGLIHIMQLTQADDDGIDLLPIKEEEELQAVYDTFFRLYADDYESGDSGETDEDHERARGTKVSKRFQVR